MENHPEEGARHSVDRVLNQAGPVTSDIVSHQPVAGLIPGRQHRLPGQQAGGRAVPGVLLEGDQRFAGRWIDSLRTAVR